MSLSDLGHTCWASFTLGLFGVDIKKRLKVQATASRARVPRRTQLFGKSNALCALGALCLAAGVAGCGASLALIPSPPVPVSTVSPIPGSPIQHIVVIMQENRSFDN